MDLFIQKYIKLIVFLLLIGFSTVAAYQWQTMLLFSAQTQVTFLMDTPLVPVELTTEQSTQVIMVVIGGLGDDNLQQLNLPNIQRLRESGATATVISQPPSYDEPTWLSLMSGVEPAFSGGEQLQAPPRLAKLNSIDTIFHRARQSGLKTMFAGHLPWQTIIPADLVDQRILTAVPDGAGDQQLVDSLGPLLEENNFDLLWLYFGQVNEAGLKNGTDSQAYRDAVLQVDAHLGLLLEKIDLAQTTLIITSDHGHIEQGGYGGHDEAVLRLPLIMAGKEIIPSTFSPVAQVDLAPTVATLLGTAIPTGNQGRPLFEMFRISDEAQARILFALIEQRKAGAEAYFQSLQAPFPNFSEIEKVRAYLAEQNFSGAATLSYLLLDEIDEAQTQMVASLLRANQRWRLWLALACIGCLALFIAWRRTPLLLYALLAAVVVVGTYHGLYRLLGLPYSFSSMHEPNNFFIEMALRVGLSLLSGLLFYLLLLALRQAHNTYQVLVSSYEWLFFSLIGFGATALYGFWQVGVTVTWHFPDIAILFLYYSALIQMVSVGVFGLLMPFIIVAANIVIQKQLAGYQRRKIGKLQAESTNIMGA